MLLELYALRAKSYELGKRVELGLSGKNPAPSKRSPGAPYIETPGYKVISPQCQALRDKAQRPKSTVRDTPVLTGTS